jgi:N-acetylmuramoyl-L-alanine amidase
MKKFIEFLINFFKILFTKNNAVDTLNSVDNEVTLGAAPVVEPMYPNVKILIDNGHGDNTPGKRSPYSATGVKPEIPFLEYQWNREIAKMVLDELQNLGYNVELLVPEITDISLSERAKRANKVCDKYGAGNVLLVSIHANAIGNGTAWMTAKGWCVYTTKGTTKSDALSEYLYTEAEKNFVGKKIRMDKSDGDKDWESNFYIIHKSKCPAVLTENFFYDNIDDTRYILSDEGKAAVVKTHVDGIINYIKDRY